MLDKKKYYTLFQKLYEEEYQLQPNAYLQSHNNHNTIYRQLDIIEKYLPYIPKNAKVLDWGCYHSPDSIILKNEIPNSDIMGCDFFENNYTPIFHKYSNLHYTQLENNLTLPYENKSFDVVISSGVLEHVAMEYESLKEIYRILKPDGIFIITFLPNHFSYTEFYTNTCTKNTGHIKKYKLNKLNKMLFFTGFLPLKKGYHQIIPSLSSGKISTQLWFLNSFLEQCFPFKYFCSNLFSISKKVHRF